MNIQPSPEFQQNREAIDSQLGASQLFRALSENTTQQIQGGYWSQYPYNYGAMAPVNRYSTIAYTAYSHHEAANYLDHVLLW